MVKQTILINGEETTFQTKKEMMIEVGRLILQGSDEPMTLRQLYYRFVANDLVENKQSQYQYLSESMKEARIDGRIPWDALEDRTRATDAGDHTYLDPTKRVDRNLEWFENTAERHYYPRWHGQDVYLEVWVEKEALAGIFGAICEELKVTTYPCRGYSSVTMLKDAAERFRKAVESGRDPLILYFGDFDPTGQDIERNVRETIRDTFDVPIDVERIALNREQIDAHELPPQPAKSSDARYDTFVEEHGDMAVELDALPPDTLKELVRDAVNERFDRDHFEDNVKPKQTEEREQIRERIGGILDR